MTVAVTACFRYVVDSELAFGDIVTRLGGHTAAAAARVIKKLLIMVVGILGCIGSAVLVKGTEASMRAMGTCNLICGSVSANTSGPASALDALCIASSIPEGNKECFDDDDEPPTISTPRKLIIALDHEESKPRVTIGITTQQEFNWLALVASTRELPSTRPERRELPTEPPIYCKARWTTLTGCTQSGSNPTAPGNDVSKGELTVNIVSAPCCSGNCHCPI
ncbi:hypothetical protein LMH87_010626 [Akanthomyces muscarius]|uniref:Uncharacterized protein n=1 Tax=Akanthomyces muscarius TaxID=2231603 RepID=A0A9W8UN57_AKAMU|nr:hypothetical protein LMH87_010626 [Akanthomyces muscarius]KAJ4154165.1 hypothetical protein LMH87_010626 [Akanthomyces muscarius]